MPPAQSEFEMTVEGITYRLLDKDSVEDVNAVIDMNFDAFYKDEPLSRATKTAIYSEQEARAIGHVLRDEASRTVIALDNKSEAYVGFFASYVFKRTTKKLPAPPILDPIIALIIQLSNRLVGPDLMFSQYPNATSILTTRKLAVREAYRNQGIANTMFDICMQVADREGYDLITVFSTSDISSRMCENLDFALTNVIKWDDVILDNGEAPFKDVKSEGAKGYVKKVIAEANDSSNS